MKFTTLITVAAAAGLASAQGYNSTSAAKTGDPRTVNPPYPTAPPTTALTSIYTITTNCGSHTVFLPSTAVYALSSTSSSSGSVTTSRPSYTGAAATPSSAGTRAMVGLGGLVAAVYLL